ncbi:hypothetical protein THAOC_07186 [Thalassiosira oceanica]|uniref:Uncharacterized protein n=1 Tax=Thalassiosira oceanica TaxID=159749 RepID=K0SY72_THAOC|nr:hypothetical protein THAOC_07186 [Thalassiosira oceanica]|eukprot:EJK71383.1 hypothetical protein THAOC_07186 [Thalassiosira oceanica]
MANPTATVLLTHGTGCQPPIQHPDGVLPADPAGSSRPGPPRELLAPGQPLAEGSSTGERPSTRAWGGAAARRSSSPAVAVVHGAVRPRECVPTKDGGADEEARPGPLPASPHRRGNPPRGCSSSASFFATAVRGELYPFAVEIGLEEEVGDIVLVSSPPPDERPLSRRTSLKASQASRHPRCTRMAGSVGGTEEAATLPSTANQPPGERQGPAARPKIMVA